MNIRDELLAVVDCLNKADLPYALCGGLAVVAHGFMRATDDIDLLVPAAYVPLVKQAIRRAGFVVATPEPMVFGRGTAREAIVHRVSKFDYDEHLILDIIEVNDENRYAWKSRRARKLLGHRVWVIGRKALIEMKRRAGRSLDLADIDGLEGRLES